SDRACQPRGPGPPESRQSGAGRRGGGRRPGRLLDLETGLGLCEVMPRGTLVVARWDDVPAVSDGFVAARDAIVARVRRLLEDAGGPRAAARAPGFPA